MQDQGWVTKVNIENSDEEDQPYAFVPPENGQGNHAKKLLESLSPTLVDPKGNGEKIPLSEYISHSKKDIEICGVSRFQIEGDKVTGLIIDGELPRQTTELKDARGRNLLEYCFLEHVGETPDEIELDPEDCYNNDEMDEDGHPYPEIKYGFFVKTETVLEEINKDPDWRENLHKLKAQRIHLPDRQEIHG